jgi:hypothetical protein
MKKVRRIYVRRDGSVWWLVDFAGATRIGDVSKDDCGHFHVKCVDGPGCFGIARLKRADALSALLEHWDIDDGKLGLAAAPETNPELANIRQ